MSAIEEIKEFMSDLISQEDLALITNTAVSFWSTMRADGEGPPVLKLGRLVRYHAPTVLAWLREQAGAPAVTVPAPPSEPADCEVCLDLCDEACDHDCHAPDELTELLEEEPESSAPTPADQLFNF